MTRASANDLITDNDARFWNFNIHANLKQHNMSRYECQVRSTRTYNEVLTYLHSKISRLITSGHIFLLGYTKCLFKHCVILLQTLIQSKALHTNFHTSYCTICSDLFETLYHFIHSYEPIFMLKIIKLATTCIFLLTLSLNINTLLSPNYLAQCVLFIH